MASKENKTVDIIIEPRNQAAMNKILKLAKGAIDKKDYETAIKHCQVSTYS